MVNGTVTIGDKQWSVSVAQWPWELTKGLGGVSSIPSMTGMLFNMGAAQVTGVTTEQMLFTIDLAFISSDYKVAEVHQHVPPGVVMYSTAPALFFLEVNDGELDGVNVGDTVAIDMQTNPISEVIQQLVPVAALGLAVGMTALTFKSSKRGSNLGVSVAGELKPKRWIEISGGQKYGMVIDKIKAQIPDEQAAFEMYSNLAFAADDAGMHGAARTLRDIANDERNHKQKLEKIYRAEAGYSA